MKNKLAKISEQLPEGLSETAVEEIFSLVDSVINEQVDTKIKLLEAKVNSFLRTKIEQLKEQALNELSEEHPVFKQAKLFESVRTLMSLELNAEDEDNAVAYVAKEKEELTEEVEVLTSQLESILVENESLKTSLKVAQDKATLSEAKATALKAKEKALNESIRDLEAEKDLPFESSERGIVISESEKEDKPNERVLAGNEFLTPEMLNLI